MSVPNLSYLGNVGELRYIQAQFEARESRGPDFLVGDCLSLSQLCRSMIRGRVFLRRLRREPFYGYLLARTRYYDIVFIESIFRSPEYIINLGAGTDTRAYRFFPLLADRGIKVLECDQQQAIEAKKRIAEKHWPTPHVEYLGVDLNAQSFSPFEDWLISHRGVNALVLMEGVSPYIEEHHFGRLLDLFGDVLGPSSLVAYDYKLRGVADNFGARSSTERLFRLSHTKGEAQIYHEQHGLYVSRFELSKDLCYRLGVSKPDTSHSPFVEDALVQISTHPRPAR